MKDEKDEKDENVSAPPAASVTDVPTLDTLFISVDRATGRVDIQGPIDNRLLCYGMLMLALEIVMGRGMAKSAAAGLERGRTPGGILVPR